jgi:hypothetical protein
MKSKKGQLKFGEAPTHLIFDDDGVAHEAIEMKAVEEYLALAMRRARL